MPVSVSSNQPLATPLHMCQEPNKKTQMLSLCYLMWMPFMPFIFFVGFFLVRWWTLANYPYLPELLSSGRGFLNAFQWTHQCHPLAHCSFSWNPPRVFPLYRFLQVTVAQKEKQPLQTGSPQICIVTASHRTVAAPQVCSTIFCGQKEPHGSHNAWDAFWPQSCPRYWKWN